jgi:hypothetical protein
MQVVNTAPRLATAVLDGQDARRSITCRCSTEVKTLYTASSHRAF